VDKISTYVNTELLKKYNMNHSAMPEQIAKIAWTPYLDIVERVKTIGKPLICCMAGHTLDLQMENLKAIDRDKYILVVIDQTHQRLITDKIIPDYCFTLDMKDFANRGFWIETENTCLVAPTVGNWDNIVRWQGEKALYKLVANTGTGIDYLFNKMQDGEFEDIGTQSCMQTVGLSVLQFCVYTQLPSYWVGLDFGYVDNVMFCDGYKERLEITKEKHTATRRLTFNDGRILDTTEEYIGFGGQFLKFMLYHKYVMNYCSPGGFFDCIEDPRYNPYIIKTDLKEAFK